MSYPTIETNRRVEIHANVPESTALNIEIIVSEECADEEWDAFLAETPEGHHVQTSMWSRLKATLGWSAVRVIAKESGHIVGGAQILIRTYGKRFRIGFVPKGPVFWSASERTMTAFINAFRDIVRAHGLNCAIVNPSSDTAIYAGLLECGFHRIRLAPFVQATTIVDLAPSLDEILMAMRRTTRRKIRQGLQRGLNVRQGSEEDLDTFYELLMATASRKGCQEYPKSYYQTLWKLFGPDGYARFFIADSNGSPVIAIFLVAFGDVVIFKKQGWAGEFQEKRPNDAVHWAAIQWAKESGFRHYDLEGISLSAAKLALNGKRGLDDLGDSGAYYKLGFGGRIQIFPNPLVYFANPVARWGHRILYPMVAEWPIIDRIANRIKVN